MYKVLVVDRVSQKFLSSLDSNRFEVCYRPGIPLEELLNVVQDYHVLVFRGRLKIGKEVIDRGANLKVLARYGIGLDNVDVEYAVKKGIAVVNAPKASAISVAELTLALMLIVFRRLYSFICEVKGGGWPKGKYLGRELYGKSLGIIGFGKIGSRVAHYASALGMRVLVYDIRDVSQEVAKLGGKQVEFEKLLNEADAISLHVPLTPLTWHMINDRTLSLIRDGGVLVNTSRGEVVDTHALLKHIDRLGGVALDVLEQEPPRDEHLWKLIMHPKVIVTPHIGAETEEALDRIAEELARNIMEAVNWV
uniref:3-phosphoglycerate dehydrogenase n=1 Tax=Ignisphaera aggregans TaxID=334771 RepID=A0A7J3Z4Q9_9CREN